MTKDYAALLAQVIPVIALALGLELRSAAHRLTNPTVRPDGTPWLVGLEGAICMPILCATELVALEYVGSLQDNDFPLVGGLAFAIILVFGLPVADAMSAVAGVYWPGPNKALARFITFAVTVAGFLIATLVLSGVYGRPDLKSS